MEEIRIPRIQYRPKEERRATDKQKRWWVRRQRAIRREIAVKVKHKGYDICKARHEANVKHGSDWRTDVMMLTFDTCVKAGRI